MLFVIALLACSSAPPHTHEGPAEHGEAHHDHDAPSSGEAHHDHDAPAGDLVLSLDGTKKWVMDEHTRDVMAKTGQTLAQADTDSIEGLHQMARTLQKELDSLISGCTMDGAAHDELHVFLMAWIPKVDSLKKVEDVDEGKATVAHLEAMLVTYGQYFE